MLKSMIANLRMIVECMKMSLDNILHNRMRSFLTVLGIMIGVTAVIALITTISGVTGSLSSSFESMGTGTLTVSVTGSDLKSGLNEDDLETLCEMDEIDGVVPNVSLVTRVSRGSEYDKGISVSGKNAYYFQNTENLMLRGRALNKPDCDNRSLVCVINQDMIDTFFFGVDPVGEKLYISGMPFLVVGIFDSDEGTSITETVMGAPDILIPYTTAMKLNGVNVIGNLTVYIREGFESEAVSDTLEDKLDAIFSYEEDCYTVTSMSSIEDTLKSMMNMMAALLAGIASIALVVGGIGIMNMMLTTVSERTTEIGLRKALGALPWQIQMQFLTESFMLSLIGGILGILLGILLSFILTRMINTDFVLSIGAIELGFGFSAAVGILFGWAPARKASKLNPIDALRSL